MDRYTKEDCLILLNLCVSDATKAIDHKNYASAADSLNRAAFWSTRISEKYGDN